MAHDSDGRDTLVFNEHTGKSAPEEIVRQLFLYELTDHYHYHIGDVTDMIGENEEAGWEWLKTYRVWDADRKEFIFPENWLDQES